MYKIICKDGRAKRATFTTVHGTVETPVFMNVGTAAAIKGAVATTDLKEIGCQIELSNTYHLHVRPGDEVVKKMGGLHKFMYWDRPILTDSGGFQVFSLAGLRKIKEEGVTFNSHVDGRKIFMGPEESMQIQLSIQSFHPLFQESLRLQASVHKYRSDRLEPQSPEPVFLLLQSNVVRISKTALLNISCLVCVKPYPNHRLLAELNNEENLIVSRKYIPILRDKIRSGYYE